ncbi:MAG: tetratricopeptide repeat protein [Pseudomonadota bacterium]
MFLGNQSELKFFSKAHIIQLYLKYAEEISSDTLMAMKKDAHGNHDGGISRVDAELIYMLFREFKPKHVIEFSPHEGYSTTFLVTALQVNDQKFTFATFDLQMQSFFSIRMKDFRLNPKVILGNALETIPKYIKELDLKNKIDFCFIDSDHSYEFAKQYTQTLFPLMSKECIYMIHDMCYRPESSSHFSHYASIRAPEICGTASARGEGQYLSEFFTRTPDYTIFSTHRLFGDCHEYSPALPRNLELIELLSKRVKGFELPKSAGMHGGFPRPPMSLILMPTKLVTNSYTSSGSEAFIDDKIKEGEILFSEGKIKEAEKTFWDLLENAPTNIEILNNLGVIRHVQGRLDEAEEFFLKALSAKDDHPDALLNLAGLCQNVGRWKESANQLEKYTSIYEQDPNGFNQLGMVYMEMGNIEKARKALAKSLELDPDQEIIRDSLNQLECKKI